MIFSPGPGGTEKYLAAKTSLQRAYHSQIMTPHQLLTGQLRI